MPFAHILVPLDFGEAGNRALELAVTIASKFDSRLSLVHAFHMPPIAYSSGLDPIPVADLARDAEKALGDALTNAKKRCPGAKAIFVDGEPRQRILEVAKEQDVDLVVMGTHGRRGLSRLFFGSVAERLVRTSPVPVLTASARAVHEKGAETTGFRHILVPTDFGESAVGSLAVAAALAEKFDAKLTLMHAHPMATDIYDEREYWPHGELLRAAGRELDAALATAKERYGRIEAVLVRGDARQCILQVASERSADLIVIGTHERRGLSRVFLGSVAEAVVRTSTIPVLSVSG